VFCPKCGTENETNASFCPSCGSQLNLTSSVTPQHGITIYAGFWRRFLAIFIDSIILLIGGVIIGAIVGASIGFAMGASGVKLAKIKYVAEVAGYIISIVLNWSYFTFMESSAKQATFGKMAIGIIVTDLNNHRISFGKANGRYWGKVVSALILCIGFIMAGFTKQKQALHDIMAGTLVVKKLQH
jgi:uncharacterized RDD family membrane protein YckC